jgi:hypothetical protein
MRITREWNEVDQAGMDDDSATKWIFDLLRDMEGFGGIEGLMVSFHCESLFKGLEIWGEMR